MGIMRWSYKTVHFGLKKDGLLGSAFLDEVEIEVSLNEYGHAGWELVSFMEVNDGLIAVFKQPLSRGILPVEVFGDEERAVVEEAATEQLSATPQEEHKETAEEAGRDEEDAGSIRIF